MLVDLQPPPWAVKLLSDLTDWQRAPVPVAEMTPFEIPDDAYFEYCWVDAAGERRAAETFVADKVAHYKQVRLVEFVEQIPKSASGKILRRMLRDQG